MVYIGRNGTVMEKRSKLSLSFVTDVFWGVVNFVGLFLRTFLPGRREAYRADAQERRSRYGGGGGSSLGGGDSGTRRRGPNIHGVRPQGEMNCGPMGGG